MFGRIRIIELARYSFSQKFNNLRWWIRQLKSEKKTTILDLPDDVIEIIFSYLNFTDRSHARVNRRLARIERNMNIDDRDESDYWKNIEIGEGKCTRMYIPGKGIDISPESITRLAKNVKIVELRVELAVQRRKQQDLLAILPSLSVKSLTLTQEEGCDKLSFSLISALLSSFERINVCDSSNSITADELIMLKEIIRKSDDHLYLKICISEETAYELLFNKDDFFEVGAGIGKFFYESESDDEWTLRKFKTVHRFLKQEDAHRVVGDFKTILDCNYGRYRISFYYDYYYERRS